MTYLDWRWLHIGCAMLSFTLFVLRGSFMLWRPQALRQRWLRVAPHIVDTVFLASGLYLATLIRQYPFTHGWLTAKVFGLIAYIILGSLALKHGRTRGARAAAFVGGIAMFLYIAGVARAHDPLSWWRFLG